MKLKIISYFLVLIIFTGCSKDPSFIYSAPTPNQITTYISENYLEVLDSIEIEGSTLILLENSLITLYSDQYEKLYTHKISWAPNDKDVVAVGNGVPYVAIILYDDLMKQGATSITVTYSDGTLESREFIQKKGVIISHTNHTEVQHITVFNAKGEELYSK